MVRYFNMYISKLYLKISHRLRVYSQKIKSRLSKLNKIQNIGSNKLQLYQVQSSLKKEIKTKMIYHFHPSDQQRHKSWQRYGKNSSPRYYCWECKSFDLFSNFYQNLKSTYPLIPQFHFQECVPRYILKNMDCRLFWVARLQTTRVSLSRKLVN